MSFALHSLSMWTRRDDVVVYCSPLNTCREHGSFNLLLPSHVFTALPWMGSTVWYWRIIKKKNKIFVELLKKGKLRERSFRGCHEACSSTIPVLKRFFFLFLESSPISFQLNWRTKPISPMMRPDNVAESDLNFKFSKKRQRHAKCGSIGADPKRCSSHPQIRRRNNLVSRSKVNKLKM